MAFRFYEREIRFFRDVAPTARVRVPEALHLDMDVDAERFVLVLEDLGHLEMADQVAGMTVEQAIAAVQAIAPFHAQWWQQAELEALDWLPAADDPITMQAAKLYEDSWPHFEEKWSHVVPAGGIELGARVRDVYRHMLTDLAVPPRTFVHTDFRLDNLFFGDGGVTVIDWQLSTKSSGVYDVAYLLSQSMDVELRKAHQDEIIGAWYERLCQAGVEDYSLDQANADYAASVLVCLVVAVATGADMDLGNKRGEALVRAIAERGFSAALDVDSESVFARLSAD
jgi:aminoglycoside/choline kinase family phosphotransferase